MGLLAVNYTGILNVPSGRVLARTSVGTGIAEAVTPSSVLDIIGNTRGNVLYRGASGWAALAPGNSGQALLSGGAGADPSWGSAGVTAHSGLTGLTSGDDHTQYALLAGRSGGQTLLGHAPTGTNQAASALKFASQSTGNATPGSVVHQSSVAGSSGTAAQTLYDTLVVTNGMSKFRWPNASATSTDELRIYDDGIHSFLERPSDNSDDSIVFRLNNNNLASVNRGNGIVVRNGWWMIWAPDPGGQVSSDAGLSRRAANTIGLMNGMSDTGQCHLQFNENSNIILGTATGTKIGTATGQKLGFWNATPVVQQVLATGAGATADNIISLLQTLGLCKQS